MSRRFSGRPIRMLAALSAVIATSWWGAACGVAHADQPALFSKWIPTPGVPLGVAFTVHRDFSLGVLVDDPNGTEVLSYPGLSALAGPKDAPAGPSTVNVDPDQQSGVIAPTDNGDFLYGLRLGSTGPVGVVANGQAVDQRGCQGSQIIGLVNDDLQDFAYAGCDDGWIWVYDEHSHGSGLGPLYSWQAVRTSDGRLSSLSAPGEPDKDGSPLIWAAAPATRQVLGIALSSPRTAYLHYGESAVRYRIPLPPAMAAYVQTWSDPLLVSASSFSVTVAVGHWLYVCDPRGAGCILHTLPDAVHITAVSDFVSGDYVIDGSGDRFLTVSHFDGSIPTSIPLPAGSQANGIAAGPNDTVAVSTHHTDRPGVGGGLLIIRNVPPVDGTFPTPVPDGQIGTTYRYQIPTSAAAPAGAALEQGTLPPGLRLTDTGLLAGTPSAAGTYTFTVTFPAGGGTTTAAPVQLTINAAAQPSNPTTLTFTTAKPNPASTIRLTSRPAASTPNEPHPSTAPASSSETPATATLSQPTHPVPVSSNPESSSPPQSPMVQPPPTASPPPAPPSATLAHTGLDTGLFILFAAATGLMGLILTRVGKTTPKQPGRSRPGSTPMSK